MYKPKSLVDALVAALDAKHHIKGDSTRLQLVISNVRPLVSARPGSGFGLAYMVEICMPDFNGSPMEVIVPLLRWLERWQHDVVANADKAAKAIDMTFVRLDDTRYDLHASIELTEFFNYAERPDGEGHDVVPRIDPPPMALETGEPLHAVFLDGELILHCTEHPDVALEP